MHQNIIDAVINNKPLPYTHNWQKHLALDIIIEHAIHNDLDLHKYIEDHHLDKLLIDNLKTKDNKILAIKNIYEAKLSTTYDLLKNYWYSKDFDESYFSLYYAILANDDTTKQKEILDALFHANFSFNRKVEMAKLLAFSNQQLFAMLKTCSNINHNYLLLELFNAPLNEQELLELAQIINHDKQAFYHSIPIMINSKAEASYTYIKDWIAIRDHDINKRLASSLKSVHNDESFQLLTILLDDTNYDVRYDAAISILAFGKQGYEYLTDAQDHSNHSVSQKMADLHLKINA
ncbi:MAG: hypothetical protein MR210_09325 [Erysipelotrichaceae bacterium]|nr:hypothetical protein [Erysipelotrichaceae bacterium]